MLIAGSVFSKGKESEVTIASKNYRHLGRITMSFMYDNITIEKKHLDNGKQELTEKDFGQSNIDKFLLDLMFNTISTKHQINLSKDDVGSDIKIKVNPIYLAHADRLTSFCDVYIFDKENKQLSQFYTWCTDLLNVTEIDKTKNDFLQKMTAELDKISK